MDIKVIPYCSEHHAIFKQMNLAWLDHYNLTEGHDLEILNDPQGKILDNGGYLWMAEADGKIIGSAGLMKEGDGEYELVKMYVNEDYRGKGISRLLIDQCLRKAIEMGGRKISLYSNSRLQIAIRLYEKYGFKHVELINSPLKTADVRMELML